MKFLDRYDLHDRLLRLAFWGFIIGFALTLAGRFWIEFPPFFATIATVYGFAVWLLMVFVIFAGFLRDEFAEERWQATSAIFAKAMIVLPALAVVAAYFWSAASAGSTIVPSPAEQAMLEAYPRPIIWQFSGALYLLLYIAAYSPFLFICIYRWKCWRDSQ